MLCHYAEYHFAECLVLFISMSVAMLNVAILNVVMLNVVMLSAMAPKAIF